MKKVGITPEDKEYKTASAILKFYSSYKLAKSVDGFAESYKKLDVLKKIEEVTPHLPKYSPFLNPESKNIKALLREAEHFEVGMQEIENAFLYKKHITELSENVQKDFGHLIKQNKQGLVTGMYHMQDHHMLLKSNPDFQEIFTRADRSIIKDPLNRILLPDEIGSSIMPTVRTMHHGMHVEDAYSVNLETVRGVLAKGSQEAWTASTYSKIIDQILIPTRSQLIKGEIRLNKARSI